MYGGIARSFLKTGTTRRTTSHGVRSGPARVHPVVGKDLRVLLRSTPWYSRIRTISQKVPMM
jgi:hypothetical protein